MIESFKTDAEISPGPVPSEVLSFWRGKGLRPSFSYLDVWKEEHSFAFAAGKIMRMDVLEAMREELEKAIVAGLPFKQFVREVEPRMKALGWWEPHEVEDPDTGKTARVNPPRRLRTIFDTNMRVARATGQWERIQRNKVTRPFLLYQVGPSERHRPDHLSWHGVLLPVDDPWWQSHYVPNGFGCFLPGTRATGRITGASKAWYAGDAIEIQTESGATLAVTPNHPIATTRGWLSAGELCVGDECIGHRGEVELVRGLSRPNSTGRAVGNDQIPSLVQDVFESLAAHGARSAKVSPLDFHGEAKRFVGKIDVVGSYVELVDNGDAAFAQRASHGHLSFANVPLSYEHGPRLLRSLSIGRLASGRSSPGRLALCDGLGPVHFLPSPVRSFGHPAHLDATNLQKPADNVTAHSAFVRELLGRHSGQIAADKIVSVRRFQYNGHVYDLESEGGWILADGLVASNCKCSIRTVSRFEADRLEREGVMAPDPEPELDANGKPTGHVVDRRIPVQRTAPPIVLVPWRNKRTGKIEFVPKGVDPGFNYPPHESRKRALSAAPPTTTSAVPPSNDNSGR